MISLSQRASVHAQLVTKAIVCCSDDPRAQSFAQSMTHALRSQVHCRHWHVVMIFTIRRSEAALTEGRWPRGPPAKTYQSAVSWIIAHQKCNFRDQCLLPTLSAFQSERLIIHICCAFSYRLTHCCWVFKKSFSEDRGSMKTNHLTEFRNTC